MPFNCYYTLFPPGFWYSLHSQHCHTEKGNRQSVKCKTPGITIHYIVTFGICGLYGTVAMGCYRSAMYFYRELTSNPGLDYSQVTQIFLRSAQRCQRNKSIISEGQKTLYHKYCQLRLSTHFFNSKNYKSNYYSIPTHSNCNPKLKF